MSVLWSIGGYGIRRARQRGANIFPHGFPKSIPCRPRSVRAPTLGVPTTTVDGEIRAFDTSDAGADDVQAVTWVHMVSQPRAIDSMIRSHDLGKRIVVQSAPPTQDRSERVRHVQRMAWA